MNSQMSTKQGFIDALDQSGGSTPGALRNGCDGDRIVAVGIGAMLD
jgi:hypothetical protein